MVAESVMALTIVVGVVAHYINQPEPEKKPPLKAEYVVKQIDEKFFSLNKNLLPTQKTVVLKQADSLQKSQREDRGGVAKSDSWDLLASRSSGLTEKSARSLEATSCAKDTLTIHYELGKHRINESSDLTEDVQYFLSRAERCGAMNLEVRGYSSPDGMRSYNYKLSKKRGASASDYIKSIAGKNYTINVVPLPQNEAIWGTRRADVTFKKGIPENDVSR